RLGRGEVDATAPPGRARSAHGGARPVPGRGPGRPRRGRARALSGGGGGGVLCQGEALAGRGEAGLARFRRRDVGFVFQFYNLLGDMSALENTMIPALIERKPPREVRDLAAAALVAGGLGARLQ